MPTISPLSYIIRAATREPDEKLNILTFPTHERYESMLAKTGHNFYAYRAEGIKDWNPKNGELPENYILLDPELEERQIPNYVDFDLVLSQNKFGQFQVAHRLAQKMHLPLVSLEHTLPVPEWGDDIMQATRSMRGDINVFISSFSIDSWGWQPFNDTTVITHGVDSSLFRPDDSIERENHALSVVNDWINRDWCCGFNIWRRIADKFPTKVVGDTAFASNLGNAPQGAQPPARPQNQPGKKPPTPQVKKQLEKMKKDTDKKKKETVKKSKQNTKKIAGI